MLYVTTEALRVSYKHDPAVFLNPQPSALNSKPKANTQQNPKLHTLKAGSIQAIGPLVLGRLGFGFTRVALGFRFKV